MKTDAINMPAQTGSGVSKNSPSGVASAVPGDFLLALMGALMQQGNWENPVKGNTDGNTFFQGATTLGNLLTGCIPGDMIYSNDVGAKTGLPNILTGMALGNSTDLMELAAAESTNEGAGPVDLSKLLTAGLISGDTTSGIFASGQNAKGLPMITGLGTLMTGLQDQTVKGLSMPTGLETLVAGLQEQAVKGLPMITGLETLVTGLQEQAVKGLPMITGLETLVTGLQDQTVKGLSMPTGLETPVTGLQEQAVKGLPITTGLETPVTGQLKQATQGLPVITDLATPVAGLKNQAVKNLQVPTAPDTPGTNKQTQENSADNTGVIAPVPNKTVQVKAEISINGAIAKALPGSQDTGQNNNSGSNVEIIGQEPLKGQMQVDPGEPHPLHNAQNPKTDGIAGNSIGQPIQSASGAASQHGSGHRRVEGNIHLADQVGPNDDSGGDIVRIAGADGSEGKNLADTGSGGSSLSQGNMPINSAFLHLSDITAPKFTSAILPYVMNAVKNAGGEGNRVTVINLKLEPENLGELKIRLSYAKGELTAHFFTASGLVKDAVEGSLPQLRETLSQYDINLGEAGAYVGQGQQNNSGGRFAGYRFGGSTGNSGIGYANKQSGDSVSQIYSDNALDLLI